MSANSVTALALLLPNADVREPERDPALASTIAIGHSILWHPHLLANAENLPEIADIANPPKGPDRIFVVPQSTFDAADPLVQKELKEPGTKLILIGEGSPAELRDDLARQLELALDPPLVHTFLALGYAYLGMRILLRHQGYSEKLEEQLIWAEVHQAAEAFTRDEIPLARDTLFATFDILHGNRQSAYPATIHWVDIAIVRNKESGTALERRLDIDCRFNLLLTADQLDALPSSSIEPLKKRLETNSVEILSGRVTDRPITLLPFESRRWEIERSLAICEDKLSRELDAFGGRVGSLTSDLPQLLMKYGYRYALHAAFDGSNFPLLRGPKIHWTSIDGSVVETLARSPIHAGRDEEALRVFARLSEALKEDRSGTFVIAHWLDETSFWYDWLLTVQKQVTVFGKFEVLSEYFLGAALPGGPTVTRAEEYGSGDLDRTDGAPSVQRWVSHTRERARFDAARSLAALARIAGASLEDDGTPLENELERETETAAAKLTAFETATQKALAHVLCSSSAKESGYLIVNPSSFPRRVGLELKGLPRELVMHDAIRGFQFRGDESPIIVDLLGYGYTWIPTQKGASPPAPSKLTAVAKGNKLKNTMIDVEVDKKTGGLRSVASLSDGYSRLGQQLGLAGESFVTASSINITRDSTLVGEITTRGKFLRANKTTAAEFTQIVRVWRGRPVARVDIVLDYAGAWSGEPVVCKWAWPDEKTVILPASGPAMQSHFGSTIEATDFLELREQTLTTNIVTGGLPYHRRTSGRTMETILLLPGEKNRTFTFWIAIDAPNPFRLTQAETWPVAVWHVTNGPPTGGMSGSILDVAGDSIHALSLVPIENRPNAVRIRLAETLGQATRATIASRRPFSDARLTNFRSELIYDLHPEDEKLPVDLSALDWQQVEIDFEESTGLA